MRSFLIRRLIFAVISIIGATAFVFVLSRMAGDPLLLYANPEGYGMDSERIDALSKKLGLDKPLFVQYLRWVGQMATGDMGKSLVGDREVRTILAEKMGATAQLAIAGGLLALVIGIPLGVLSAVKRGTIWDYIGRSIALFGQATPTFWVGVVGVLVFAVWLDWLPSGTRGTGFSVRHLILPAVTVGTGAAATYLRLTRAAMLEVLDSEFIKLARAKGVPNQSVIWKHAFRNSLIQPITVSALLFAHLLTGTVVAEVVFAWPGLGRVMVESVWSVDFPILTGAMLLFVVLFMFFNLMADILYVVVDPRIRLE